MREKNILVTGRPGIGKTTAVLRAVHHLRSTGLVIGGFISREERREGTRVGFIMIDLMTGEEAYLARVGEGRPRVGKYVVLVDELDRLGVGAILTALNSADVVIIDEIGPMELLSTSFKRAVRSALDSSKPVIATIHAKAELSAFGKEVLERKDYTLIVVTESNRNDVPHRLVELVHRITSKKQTK
ncbi:MAG: NTPase [Thermofilaceae archaeon]|nr:NTPase [Thermofilaceae archaeon]